MHDDHSEGGVPGPQLPEPLSHDGGGAHNDGGLEHSAAVQASQEGSQLYGFAQAHFVPDDAPGPLSVQLPHPFDAWTICSARVNDTVWDLSPTAFTASTSTLNAVMAWCYQAPGKLASRVVAEGMDGAEQRSLNAMHAWTSFVFRRKKLTCIDD